MTKLFVGLFIIFLIHGGRNIYLNKVNFYNWYEAAALPIIDEFIIRGIPSYLRLMILIFFIYITYRFLKEIDLLRSI
ncbi:MAG: hypothetical protein SOU08_02745 [Anaerococcus sp.]|nr:hypothetical protein [Anaerococcus sp.]